MVRYKALILGKDKFKPPQSCGGRSYTSQGLFQTGAVSFRLEELTCSLHILHRMEAHPMLGCTGQGSPIRCQSDTYQHASPLFCTRTSRSRIHGVRGSKPGKRILKSFNSRIKTFTLEEVL